MSNRWYILGVVASLVFGIIMTLGIYFYAVSIYAILIFSILAFLIVLISVLRKDSKWKIALQILSFLFIAALTSNTILGFLQNRNRRHRDEVISAIYEYRQKTGKFPDNLNYLPKSISSVKFNYIPDSTFTNFKCYFRDTYGFPRKFISKDSLWEY